MKREDFLKVESKIEERTIDNIREISNNVLYTFAEKKEHVEKVVKEYHAKQIKSIVDEYKCDIETIENEMQRMYNDMTFLAMHNFHEEKRVLKIKFDAMSDIFNAFSRMHKQLSSTLKGWEATTEGQE